MTPDESTTLVGIGKDLRQTFAAIIFEALIFSIYGVCVYKAYSILNRGTRTWMATINMMIIITMFLIATTLLGIDIANYVTVIDGSFIHNPDLSVKERYGNASDVTFKRVVVIDALYGYMTVLGDVIIVWRVYAFWGSRKRRWALFLLGAMVLGSLITMFLLTYCVSVLGTDIFDGSFQKPVFCRDIQTTSYAMPAATTFVATALIGVATWEYRRTIKLNLPGNSRMTRAEKVMLLLIESGFIYFLFFLAQVIDNVPAVSAAISSREDLSFADIIFTFSSSVIVGCYPTLIIILAHSKRTVLDSVGSATQIDSHNTTVILAVDSEDSIGSPRRGVRSKRENGAIDSFHLEARAV